MAEQKWYRIDKSNGQIAMTGFGKVLDAARSHYDVASNVIATGRFQTPFAIYALGDQITDDEWAHGSIAPAGCKL